MSLTNLLYVLLLANPGAGDKGSSNPLMSMLPLLLIIVVFYFFMIRPQSKRMKTQKKFLENLSKGDNVITVGGIHGVIKAVLPTHIELEISHGVIIKVQRASISPEASQALNSQPTK